MQPKARRDEDEYVAHVASHGAVRIGGNADLLCERPVREAGGPACRAASGTWLQAAAGRIGGKPMNIDSEL